MGEFILNVIHRPEMVPEYSATVTGHGKEEDIGDKKLLTESLDIFKTQQRLAHENGLKVTIHMTYAALFNDEAVQIAKDDHEKYGDEIALSLLGLPCEQFRDKYKTKDFCIWMFSMEDKKTIVDDVFAKFHERFGFYPESTGSYYMDAELTNYIKEKYPMVKWHTTPAIIPGIPYLTEARGRRGSRQSRILMHRRRMRRRILESLQFRICPETCLPATTATALILEPIPRMCCGA